MKYKKYIKKGFTLVEVIIYIAITSVVMISVTALFSVVLESRIKSQIITEVNDQGILLMQIFTQTIRNGSGVNSPALGASASTISLSSATASINPTIFTLTNGKVTIQEGSGSAIDLTSNRVSVSSLTFQNVSGTSAKANIKIQFTINSTNTTKQEYNYSLTFNDSATIR